MSGPAPLCSSNATIVDAVLKKHARHLGDGEGVKGLYGTLTLKYLLQIYGEWARHGRGLTAHSHLLDVGSGISRSLAAAWLVEPRILTSGIEFDSVKVQKARPYAKRVREELVRRNVLAVQPSLPVVLQEDVEIGLDLDRGLGLGLEQEGRPPRHVSHVYAFWEGFSDTSKAALGAAVAAAQQKPGVITVVQRRGGVWSAAAMHQEYGFPGSMSLVSNMPVKMAGSGQQFRAYTFVL